MRVNIIGAGITGLAAAHFLSREGHEVSVFESASEVGGLSGFFPVEGAYLEKYYHHIFSGHRGLIDLMRELNLEKEIYFDKTKMGFFYDNSIYPFAGPKDLLNFKPLRMRDRIRLGLSSLMMMREKDWKSMERQSALEWLKRYSGEASFRIVWEPLLKMKFGDNYDRISAAWLRNRVVDRKKSKEAGAAKDSLGYMRTGYKILFDTLVERIRQQKGEIYTGTKVEEISVENGTCHGIISNGGLIGGDAVLSTIPLPAFISLVPSLPDNYVRSLSSIKYQGSTCVIIKLKESLSDYYWINVNDPHSPFVGIIEHTRLASPGLYGNRHLVYLTKYSSSEDRIFSKPDEDIYRDFISHLKKIFPKVGEDIIEEHWVFQDRYSQPVFVQNYSKIMPDTSTPVRNLYMLNTSQLYPESRCLNSSILKAKEVVSEMVRNDRK